MERLSIKSDVEKSQGAADLQRLQHLESSLLQLYDEQATLTARWQAERSAVVGVNELLEKIAEVQLEIEKAEREYDLNTAAELKYGTLPQLEEQLEQAKTKEEDQSSSEEADGLVPMLRDEVVPDDIANVISGECMLCLNTYVYLYSLVPSLLLPIDTIVLTFVDTISSVVSVWTGIPSAKLLETEKDRVLAMADELRQRVVGQDEAIEIVTDAIQRSRAGMNDPSKPIASMIFLGPT